VLTPTSITGSYPATLISTNGGSAYVVEDRQDNYSHDCFSVIPLAAVRLMTIGKYAGLLHRTAQRALP
jgi:hypothetical protein